MNTLKFNIRFILVIVFMILFISGCQEIKDYEDAVSKKTCPEVQAEKIPNQLIVHFADEANPQAFYDSLERYFDVHVDIIKTCNCDENLQLIETDREIDPNDWRRTSTSRPTYNGDLTSNMEIKLLPFPGLLDEIYNNKPPAQLLPADNVVVAVMDGGLNKEDLPGGFILDDYTYDFTQPDIPVDPSREITPHGTLVSKIIINGMNSDDIKLMDLKIFDQDNKGSLFDAICATSYAIQNNADIINMSWGYYTEKADSTFLRYLDLADDHDIIVIAAAGNNTINTDNCLHFPSGFNHTEVYSGLGNVISVASLNDTIDRLEGYSNYGSATIGIAALEGDDGVVKGTSFAAPTVTRTAARIRKATGLDNKTIVNCILNNSIYVPELEGLVRSKGKLNESVDCIE